MRPTLLTLALAVAVAAPAAAQKLTLDFHDGRVTVDATSVPVRTILGEWAKLGGTKVIGGERVAGAPLTLKLVDVPESQALEVILRSVAGYMAAPRSTGSGASIYDRILVMATSSVPPPAAVRPAPRNTGMAGTQRFVPPRRPPQQQEPDEEPEEEDPNPPNPPVFTFPQPGQNGVPQPGMFNNGQVNVPPVMINGQPVMPGGQNITVNPAQPNAVPIYQPAMPVGSPTPGMIAPPPPTTIQTRPTTQPSSMIRPPGR
jgi:hypothetical protein